MNIRHLKSSDIDKKSWDECIDSASNSLIYANSWYLDIVHPGWEALVMDNYKAVFPLTFSKKFGLPCLFQPLYAQQLGLFSDASVKVSVDAFLEKLPRFIPKLIRLNHDSRPEIKRHSQRMNYILRLTSRSEMEKNFSENTSRNIKKAADSVVEASGDIDAFIGIKKSAGLTALKEEQWKRMRNLMNELQTRGLGELRSVSMNGEMQSAVFFAEWKERIYYLFSASTEEGKKFRASFAIVNDLLVRRENSGKILDFEGSMDENVARFFKGFGAIPEIYYEIKTLF